MKTDELAAALPTEPGALGLGCLQRPQQTLKVMSWFIQTGENSRLPQMRPDARVEVEPNIP